MLSLADAGLNHCEIARRTGIPRTTIRDWRAGKIPGRHNENACPQCGHPVHNFDALPRSRYAYLLGVYLGDGCISTSKKGVHVLRVFQDARYVDLVQECAEAMRAVMPTSGVTLVSKGGGGCTEIVSSSKAWPCLFPQHGPGRKHERTIVLEPWQRELVDVDPRPLLRGLIHSDGWRGINKSMGYEYLRYQFDNASRDIRKVFCNACDQLGIPWRQSNTRTISISRREGVEMLDSFIGPKS